MSFSIKCNKCGTVVNELKDNGEWHDNETLTDEDRKITVSSIAGYHHTSRLDIKCECGNEA